MSNPQQTGGSRLSPGLKYMVGASFFFSLMSLLVKLAGQRLPSQEVVLARAVVTLVVSLFLLRRSGRSPWGNRKGLLLLRGALGFGGLYSFYWALVHLPLADATVIQYTNPVLTALMAAALLGERLGRRELAALGVSLAGVILVARPAFLFGGVTALDPLAVGVALTGATFAAAAYVTVRRLGASEDPLVVVFYFPLVATPAVLPLVIPVWVTPTPWEWALLLGVGLTTQVAQVLMTKGLALERAGRATAVTYLQIVFAAAWGALFFAEIPDGWTLGGAALIVGATLAISRTRPRTGRDVPVSRPPR